MKFIITNWKTSLVGLLAAVLVAGPQLAACLRGAMCDWNQILLGVLLGALGLGAKDTNVTGGTVKQ